MILRRRQDDTPDVPELRRVAEARATIEAHAANALVSATLNDLEQALVDALDDRERLAEALGNLRPHEATAELKAALWARPDPMAPDTQEILALRRRFEAVHQVRNRLDDLERRIGAVVVDAEALAATAIVSSVDASGSELDAAVRDLRVDVEALSRAHTELAQIGGGR